MAKDRRSIEDSDPAQPSARPWRGCDHPGCPARGQFRAPRTRDPKDGSFWFCLGHVRVYNAAWDFFAGMSQKEIEDYQRANSTWQRPTWRLGNVTEATFQGWVRDDLGLLSELGAGFNGKMAAAPSPADPRERAALATLDLQARTSLQEVKSRYKQLVKRFHPDANGGDKKAEERLKVINQAYAYLMTLRYE